MRTPGATSATAPAGKDARAPEGLRIARESAACLWGGVFVYSVRMESPGPEQPLPPEGNVPMPPGAVPLFTLDDPRTQKLAHLTLHEHDLQFALQSLESLGLVPVTNDHLREALWRSAIVHFFKCFGDSGENRRSLQCNQIYKREPKEALEAFTHFKNLRNKHYVHDDNAYQQCVVAVYIGDGIIYQRVAGVQTFVTTVGVMSAENITCLRSLIQCALQWISAERKAQEQALLEYLRTLPIEQLTRRPGIPMKMPGPNDAGKERPKREK